MNKTERRIVAWLRGTAEEIDIGGPYYHKSGPYWNIANAIERGDHRDKQDG